MIHVLITGANGQLGSELDVIGSDFPMIKFISTTKSSLNICDYKTVEAVVIKNKIDVIINCAAYTDVDLAEVNQELADAVNYRAVKNLGLISKEHQVKLIHISTDYVFDGNDSIPYKESDRVNPQCVYGASKMKGEKVLLNINPKNSVIIRTSWLYSSFGKNFVKTILKLSVEKEHISVVSDQWGAPTYALDLARTILKILPFINNENVEIYHYTNDGVCSWFEFAKKIIELSKQTCEVVPVTSAQFNAAVNRPKYSVLEHSKIKNKFKMQIPNWEESLKKYLEVQGSDS